MSEAITNLSDDQLNIISKPSDLRVFIEGPAGCGKTTTGVERVLELMAQGIGGESILLLLPQRTLAGPYSDALLHPGVINGGMVSILTIGGLAQRMTDLFWPLVSHQAGFAKPDELPVFLTMETAQYYMAHLVAPLLDEGYFGSVTIDRNRLYSQIIDNLNKAAFIGFPYTEIGERLKGAWTGDPGQIQVYEEVQLCVTRFREYCLVHNLLDFSLQIEVFRNHVWPLEISRQYLHRTYRHLIYDNLEEDTPVAHDILVEWLPEFDSALLIYDSDAGYRRFLGADTQTAYQFKDLCDDTYELNELFVSSTAVQALNDGLTTAIRQPGIPIVEVSADQPHKITEGGDPGVSQFSDKVKQTISPALELEYHRFFPEMLNWVADQTQGLVYKELVPPSEIVIVAPYMSDALRFSLINRLEAHQVPVRAHRPSRSLREEPAALCLLTLAAIANPTWGYVPSKFDFAYALVQAIEGLDLIRAQLLSEIVFRGSGDSATISSFDLINPQVQERITYRLGERYERLRQWLDENKSEGVSEDHEEPFDYFLSRLFGEVLSQPGFCFHENYQSGEIAANLIESVQKFRRVVGGPLSESGITLGKEYQSVLHSGVIQAQFIRSWADQQADAVLIAPAYTFLMSNRPVAVQFWLDIGSRGWYQRLNQPLTQPFVLSRDWQPGRLWTDQDEIAISQDNLFRLTVGLLRRCRQRLYLGLSDLGEAGYEQRGMLLHAFQRVLRGVY